MAKEKKARDKAAEKAVKSKLQQTHLKYMKVLGSEKNDNVSSVYLLRSVEVTNYLFKVNCTADGNGTYSMSGLIPVSDSSEFGEYKVYNPQPATADALRPTGKEKKFTGYK